MKNHITLTINFVKEKLEGAEAGHDWFHIERVWKLSKKIAEKEGGNLEVIELSALLHDIADPKFHNGDETLALKISQNFLEEIHVNAELIEQVLFVIKNISFKNRAEAPENPSLELQIVQDADRLDAIGAIGIARTFQYSGARNQPIYDPTLSVRGQMTREEYRHGKSSAINHFYEKLLQLKDGLHTQTAKEVAEKRHALMEQFLDQFFLEWEGNA